MKLFGKVLGCSLEVLEVGFESLKLAVFFLCLVLAAPDVNSQLPAPAIVPVTCCHAPHTTMNIYVPRTVSPNKLGSHLSHGAVTAAEKELRQNTMALGEAKI